LWRFTPPHFTVAGLCFAKPLYATVKRQLPGTLGAIPKILNNTKIILTILYIIV